MIVLPFLAFPEFHAAMKTQLLTTLLLLRLAPVAAQVAPDWEALETLREAGNLEEALELLESRPQPLRSAPRFPALPGALCRLGILEEESRLAVLSDDTR